MRDGLTLNASGRLIVPRADGRSRLERLIAEACSTGVGKSEAAAGGMQIARPSGRRAFSVIVSPLRLREIAFLPRVPAAVVFVSDGERDIAASALLS